MHFAWRIQKCKKKNQENLFLSTFCKTLTEISFPLTLFDLGREGHYGPPTMNLSAAVTRSELPKPNFLTCFLWMIARFQEAGFDVCSSKNWKNLTSKTFWGPWALGENQKKLKKKIFAYFFKLNLNWTFSQLSFEVHCTIKTQNFWNFWIFKLKYPSIFSNL